MTPVNWIAVRPHLPSGSSDSLLRCSSLARPHFFNVTLLPSQTAIVSHPSLLSSLPPPLSSPSFPVFLFITRPPRHFPQLSSAAGLECVALTSESLLHGSAPSKSCSFCLLSCCSLLFSPLSLFFVSFPEEQSAHALMSHRGRAVLIRSFKESACLRGLRL